MELMLTTGGLVLAGILIGILSGLLGVGGGMMVIPLLRLVVGVDAVVATATSLFTIFFTSLSGAISHIRLKSAIPQLGIALGVGGAITSSLGVYLSSLSPSWAIMVAAAIIILYSSTTMLRKAIRAPKSTGEQDKSPEKGTTDENSDEIQNDSFVVTRKVLLQGLVIGMCAGLAAGYVGVGGGFLMVPLMIAFFKLPMKRASGTSLVAMIILAIPGIVGHAALGHVDFIAGIALAVGTIPGAAIGARLAQRVPERALRFAFAAMLAVAAVLLVIKETGVMG